MIRRVCDALDWKDVKKPYPKLVKNKTTGSILFALSKAKFVMLVKGNGSTSTVGELLTDLPIYADLEDFNDVLSIQNE